MSRHPHPLTKVQEAVLARRARRGDAAASDALVEANLWIIPRAVGHMLRFPVQPADREELEAEGRLGLVEAVRRFDPKRGTRLSSYATYWIRMRVRDKIRKLTGRQMVSIDGLPTEQERTADSFGGSLREPAYFLPLRDRIESPDAGPDAEAQTSEELSRLRDSVSRLELRAQFIVRSHYGIGLPRRTQRWLAKKLRVSQQRVAQILTAALSQLRTEVAGSQ